jgi:nicotinamidase-related amidase
MDSHHPLHIAHPHFWSDGRGNHPDPFTVISNQDIQNGKWIPREDIAVPPMEQEILAQDTNNNTVVPADLYDSSNGKLNIRQWCLEYTSRLETKGKFQLMIWPEHCLIGTDGHNLTTNIASSLMDWCRTTGGSVEWVHKGQHLLTEMYSALCAEVPVNKCTSFNYELMESVRRKFLENIVSCFGNLCPTHQLFVLNLIQYNKILSTAQTIRKAYRMWTSPLTLC